MPIKITCKCGQGFAVKERLAGKTFECPKCGARLKISQPTAPERPAVTKEHQQAAPKHPERPPPSAPIGDPTADPVEEAGLRAAPPPNLCPSCRNAMPPGAILCIHCGYHQQLGRKVDTKLGSAPTPPSPAASADAATAAAPKKGPFGLVTAGLNLILPKKGTLKLVATGLNLVFWGVLLYLIEVLVEALPTLIFTPSALSLVCSGATVAATLLRIAGCILCLNVPKESSAKGLILAVVIMEPLAVLISLGLVPGIQRHVAYILRVGATVVFIFFLKQLAGYLKRSDLAEQALSLRTGGICAAGILIFTDFFLPRILWVLGPSPGVTGFLGLGGLIFLVYVIYLGVQYVMLLRSLRQEILSRTRR